MSPVAVRTIRLGTRRSALALAQAESVAQALRGGGHQVELVEVVTEGDRSAAAVAAIGSTGVFVNELRRRLADGAIDVAVHSYKDLPTAEDVAVVVAAVPTRADPRDALVSRTGTPLALLPDGTRVGTGSPRRAAQLRGLGLGLVVEPMRGNVDTRLRAVADGSIDAVVVAAAGLERLGRLDEASELLDPGQMLPAPAQGALAVECRTDDVGLRDAVRDLLDDPATHAAVTAERAVLAALAAGCTAPVAALADVAASDNGPDELYLRALVAAVDGTASVRRSATGTLPEAAELGAQLAADLLEAGAAGLLGDQQSIAGPP